MRRHFLVAALLVAAVSHVVGQKQMLTDQDKADAIRIGTKEKGRLTGVLLTEGVRFGDAMLAGMNHTTVSTGFTVRVYTPMTWLEQLASNAAKEYRPLAIADVTDAMVEPVLRVIATPDKPTTLTANGMANTSSVEHIVLRNAAKTSTVQPISKEPFSDVASSALRDAAYQGLVATFPLDGVRELRGPKGDGEIIVVVVGTGKEREFTIKKKHFERLP